jgi:hypothetical protein
MAGFMAANDNMMVNSKSTIQYPYGNVANRQHVPRHETTASSLSVGAPACINQLIMANSGTRLFCAQVCVLFLYYSSTFMRSLNVACGEPQRCAYADCTVYTMLFCSLITCTFATICYIRCVILHYRQHQLSGQLIQCSVAMESMVSSYKQ